MRLTDTSVSSHRPDINIYFVLTTFQLLDCSALPKLRIFSLALIYTKPLHALQLSVNQPPYLHLIASDFAFSVASLYYVNSALNCIFDAVSCPLFSRPFLCVLPATSALYFAFSGHFQTLSLILHCISYTQIAISAQKRSLPNVQVLKRHLYKQLSRTSKRS